MVFEKIKRNFGFGAMRLKMNGDEVDYDEFNRMIDAFIGAGFNYFDTAFGYIDGKSQTAIRDCLVARYDREAYVLANKVTVWHLNSDQGVARFFDSQLALCGVDYFDMYLVHAVNRQNYEEYRQYRTFEVLEELKEHGKIRHIAMSFHDTADVLDRILSEQPIIEAVQLQLNYLDMDDPGVQSRACYDVAVKHGKKVIVMEPVKGGALANLPPEAAAIFDELGTNSYASYALRYAAALPEVCMVLSGMGNMDMVRDNIRTMSDPTPLSERELEAIDRVRDTIRRVNRVNCTACRYCTEVCPRRLRISEMFDAYNRYVSAQITRAQAKEQLPKQGGLITDCIGCGQCEQVCPQNIEIPNKLAMIAKRFELKA